MAQIHGKSGSIKYLLNGTRPMNGKRLESLEEIQYFWSHYDEVLAKTERTAALQQDEKILALNNDEIQLIRELQDRISRRTSDVDSGIGELNRKIAAATGFIPRMGYRVRHWIAVALRDYHIQGPFRKLSADLKNVQSLKTFRIQNKQTIIQQERNNVAASYQFLKSNESFFTGAKGEEVVISALSRLPDDFHVINDVNLRFHQAIHWRKMDDYIKTSQIDHIVAGPTGIFLLETKNWKAPDIVLKADKLTYQLERADYALWAYTKKFYRRAEQPRIYKVVVSLKGNGSNRKLGKYIDIVTPRQVCDHIMNRKSILSEEAVNKFVGIVIRNRSGR